MNAERKYRLLSIRVRFLREEHKITSDISKEAIHIFSAELSRMADASAPQPDSTIVPSSGSTDMPALESCPETTPDEKDSDIKSLYKKVVALSHPDRLQDRSDFEKKHKASLFRKALQSYEEDDYCTLAGLAEELEINLPRPSKNHVALAKRTISRLEQEIKKMKNTYAWVWYNEESMEKRENIMEKYIETIRKNNTRH